MEGESLAGRITYLELGPFDVLEIDSAATETLWVRGWFPRSFLSETDDLSMTWWRNFTGTYLERDIAQVGPRIAAKTLRRFWTMLAHNQAQMLNAANLARGLGVDGKTVASYLDLLMDLLLVHRSPALHRTRTARNSIQGGATRSPVRRTDLGEFCDRIADHCSSRRD